MPESCSDMRATSVSSSERLARRATCRTSSEEMAMAAQDRRQPRASGCFQAPAAAVPVLSDHSYAARLQALAACHDVELDALAFAEAPVAVGLDLREVDEDV